MTTSSGLDQQPPIIQNNITLAKPTISYNGEYSLPYKYSEPDVLKELKEYVDATYSEHYVNPKDNVQVMDLMLSSDCATDFCRGSAIKYLCRYGKKAGKNRKDLLKAAHYLLFLLSFEKEN